MVLIFGRMEGSMKENFTRERCRVWVYLRGLIVYIYLNYLKESKYEGEYYADMKQGKGKFTYPKGITWEGSWYYG
jgi:hypothetical protein